MKFAISQEQRDFFKKKGFVPFADLMSLKELASLNQGIEAAIRATNKKFGHPKLNMFQKGRDLWRKDEKVKKIVHSKRLIDLAFDLIQKKPIRLAFDQILPEEMPLTDLFPEAIPYQEHSCINNIVGMFIICLKKNSVPTEDSSIEEGGGYFLLPTTSITLEELTGLGADRFMMIAYCDRYSQYLYEIRDPQVHFLKSLGYVFGDRLNDQLHPILLR